MEDILEKDTALINTIKNMILNSCTLSEVLLFIKNELNPKNRWDLYDFLMKKLNIPFKETMFIGNCKEFFGNLNSSDPEIQSILIGAFGNID